MINAQEWLDRNYPDKKQTKEIKLSSSEELYGELTISNYSNLERIDIRKQKNLAQLHLNNCLELIKLDCNSNEILVNLTIVNCPSLKELIAYGCQLTNLNINHLKDLKTLYVFNNNLVELNIDGCINLRNFYCHDNRLVNLNLVDNLKLEALDVRNNNFNQDLFFLKDLVDLKELYLGNYNQERIQQNICNRFKGGLEPLENLNKLKVLEIKNTDIESGLEHLPYSLKEFYCSVDKKNNLFADEWGEAKTDEYGLIINFSQKLHDYKPRTKQQWIKLGFTEEEVKQWINAGFQLSDYNYPQEWRNKGFADKQTQEWTKAGVWASDYEFAVWLRDIKSYTPEWIINYKEDYKVLSERFKKYSLCSKCNQPNTGEKWCKDCNSKRLQKEFSKWTSNNLQIDQFIQKYQLEATESNKFLEWIPYKKFTDIEYLAEGGFGKVYKAKWIGGNISHWDTKNNQWNREKDEDEKKKNYLTSQIEKRETYLEKLKEKLKSNSKFDFKRKEREEKLILLFEAHLPIVESSLPVAFAHLPLEKKEQAKIELFREKFTKELGNIKQKLSKKIANKEIEGIYQSKIELVELEKKLGKVQSYKWVVLKSLNNSSENTEFLQETEKHKIIDDWFQNIVPCYGLSQDPTTGNYLMIMKYIEGGDLRKYLTSKKLTFADKLKRLTNIIQGLKDVHQKNLVHRDFHSGNILNDDIHSFITDLGLCKPVDETDEEEEVYGVLPYVAPEVLNKKGYTSASDIYSLGVIAYEIFANSSPYLDKNYDTSLALEICQGLRPNLDKVKIPQLLKDLINRCWSNDPKKRPTAQEIERILRSLPEKVEFIEEYNQMSQDVTYKFHPTATMASKLINTKKITQLLQQKTVAGKYHIGNTEELTLDNYNFGEFDIQEEKEETSIEEQNQLNSESWTNINSNFTELIKDWQNLNFTYQQYRDWINAGLGVNDYKFASWLRDTKNLTPLEVLNNHQVENLKQEFLQSQQSAQIIQTNLPNFQNK